MASLLFLEQKHLFKAMSRSLGFGTMLGLSSNLKSLRVLHLLRELQNYSLIIGLTRIGQLESIQNMVRTNSTLIIRLVGQLKKIG